MPLDPTKPTDQELNSTWPWWIRAVHAYINALESSIPSGAIINVNSLIVAAGDNSLTVGIDVSDLLFEVIFINGVGVSTIQTIYGGSNGQVKIFIHQSALVSWCDGLQSGGQIYLNQLPVASIFAAQLGDVLVLVNVGGNGSTEHGYWKELYRQMAVK